MSQPGSLRVARLFGIPVYLHASWLVIFGLITWTLAAGYFPSVHPDLPAGAYWVKALVASLFLFLSILLHELSHALVALHHGIGIRSITLFIFGGVAQMEKDPPDGETEFRIAVVGPLTSLALAGLFWLASTLPLLGSAGQMVARYLAVINLILAVFNLVPAFPLDGGRILRGLLWRGGNKIRATRIAVGAGTLFAYVLIVTGVLRLLQGMVLGGMWQVLIGWFLKEAAAGAGRGAQLDDTLAGLTVADAMVREPATLAADLSLAEAAQDHFARTGYGGYPVLRGKQAVGLLCLRDVLRVAPQERESISVQAVMTPLGPDTTIEPAVALRDAVARLAEQGRGRLVVVEGTKLAGLLTLSTVIRHARVREQLRG